MKLYINQTLVKISREELERIVSARLQAGATPSPFPSPLCPIGDNYKAWGVYAGICRGGASDYHLIVGPELSTYGMPWQDAMEQAETLTSGGFSAWALPTRSEQALMFANVPELFEKEWYWSGEQHASRSSSAWCQTFGNGHQSIFNKGTHLRARAVYRLSIGDLK